MQIHEITLREGLTDFLQGLSGTMVRGPIGQQLGLNDPRVKTAWEQVYKGVVDRVNRDPRTANLPPQQKQAEVEKQAAEVAKQVPPTPADPVKTSQALQQILRSPGFRTPPKPPPTSPTVTPQPAPSARPAGGYQPSAGDVEDLVQGPDGRWYAKSAVPRPKRLVSPRRALPAPAAPQAPAAPAAPTAPTVTAGGPTPAEYAKLQQRISQATGQPIPKRGFRIGKKR